MKYWGWIPRLTRDFYIKNENNNGACGSLVSFEQATITDFDEIFLDLYSVVNNYYAAERSLSDHYLDAIFKRYHKVELIPTKNGDDLNIRISIKSPIGEVPILVGLANVHPNGIVLYELENGFKKPTHFSYSYFDLYKYLDNIYETVDRLSPPFNDTGNDQFVYAMQMHKLIRDIFHKHVHHSTDLLLPPVRADNEKEAMQKIMELFFSKFMEYKNTSVNARPKLAIEDFFRAEGEIEYAKTFLDIHIREFMDGKAHNYKKNLNSFSDSFDVLLKRLQIRLDRAHNCMIISVSFLILSITIMAVKLDVFERVKLGMFSDILVNAFIVSALLPGIYFLWEFVKNEILPQKF
jgi:hypothetical protein